MGVLLRPFPMLSRLEMGGKAKNQQDPKTGDAERYPGPMTERKCWEANQLKNRNGTRGRLPIQAVF